MHIIAVHTNYDYDRFSDSFDLRAAIRSKITRYLSDERYHNSFVIRSHSYQPPSLLSFDRSKSLFGILNYPNITDDVQHKP